MAAAVNTFSVGHAFVFKVDGSSINVYDDLITQPLREYGGWIKRIICVCKVALDN